MLELIDTTGLFVSKGLKLLSKDALESTVELYDTRVVIYAVLFVLVVTGTVGMFVLFTTYASK